MQTHRDTSIHTIAICMQKAAEIHKETNSYTLCKEAHFIHLPLEIISSLPLCEVFPIETECRGDALHSDGPD